MGLRDQSVLMRDDCWLGCVCVGVSMSGGCSVI
jgi:hypothetical protein